MWILSTSDSMSASLTAYRSVSHGIESCDIQWNRSVQLQNAACWRILNVLDYLAASDAKTKLLSSSYLIPVILKITALWYNSTTTAQLSKNLVTNDNMCWGRGLPSSDNTRTFQKWVTTLKDSVLALHQISERVLPPLLSEVTHFWNVRVDSICSFYARGRPPEPPFSFGGSPRDVRGLLLEGLSKQARNLM